MSSCIITEGRTLGKYEGQVMRPTVSQIVSYTVAAYSAALEAETNFIRVISDADVHIAFGAVATASDLRIPANTVEYFAVAGGEQVSCYDGSS